MKIKISLLSLLLTAVLLGCSSDDDSGNKVELRDRGEVEAENRATVENFLETHSFSVISDPSNPEYDKIKFDSLSDGGNPIMESDKLKSKTYTQDDVSYKIYYLKIFEGAAESYKLTPADRGILSFTTYSMSLDIADAVAQPSEANLPGGANSNPFIRGATEGLTEFRGASNVMENDDGTLSFSDDYGIGAIFIPSGLAYYASPPLGSGIGEYEPIIFSFRLYKSIQADHDNDGIPSYLEDVNGDGYVRTDDTDNDGTPNYLDPDDDGDNILTADEIEVNDANGDGIITEDEIDFIDTSGDGTPDYLDPDA